MKHRYWLVPLLAFFVAATPLQSAQAQSELVVEWADADGNVLVNALRDAIANDTERPDDRVYVLRRGGFYWNEDRIQYDGFHLRLVGETAEQAGADAFVCGDSQTEDCGPAILQRVRRADQSVDGVMLQNTGDGSHLTMRNIWLMGQDSDGVTTAYEQIQLDAANARFIFDNVVFDRNDWHFLGPNSENCDMYITNSFFRNLHGPSQQWEGLGVRFEVGADSVVFDNNTFMNIGFTPFQSEAAPMNYFRANHNTFVNVGRSFQAGALWKEAYIANNLFVNPFWHGERPEEYNDSDRVDPFAGFFSIGALPARFGTNFDREIVFANNGFWRDPALEALYPDSIRAQPIVNDTTMAYFEAFDNMVFEGNYVGEAPGLTTYPDLNSVMMENITQIRLGNSTAPTYRWDPGREEDCFVCNVWPLPENFSYTNATLSAGGTDGLPVGDLNWYPAAKADYETNKAGYLSELESKAEGVALISVVITEGEEGTLNDDASIYAPDGFSSFFMQGSGFIEWTFDLETAGTYGLNLQTNMRSETQRGQRVFMNGVNLRNNEGFGEYYFCTTAIEGCANPLPNNEWTLVEIRDGGLFEGADALTLEAGTHIVRVEPSWGWQGFSGMEIVDGAGNPVASATAVEATYEGVIPECEEGQYCPQGFKAATLEAGGSVSWTVDAPGTGDYLVRVFYQTPNGPTNGSLLLNGETVFGSLFFNGEAGELETLDLFTDRFAMTQGSNTITIMSDQGGLNVDYVQVLSFGATGTSNERAELPDGYELEQNYPNPFNPTTTIAFSLGNADQVTLTVYDVLGRRVHTLVDGNLPSGRHQFTWQGRDAAGSLAASGVYFYRLETSVGTQVRSMLLVK